METYRHVSQIINTNLNHTKGLLAPENTPYALPFTFLRGAKPGPSLVVTGGLHSGEYPGVAACARLSQTLSPEDLAGSVLLLHCVNETGFFAHSEALVPEGNVNLNGDFPGDLSGTPGKRLVAFMEQEIMPFADYILDLHSGGGMEPLSPCLFFPVTAGENVLRTSLKMAEPARRYSNPEDHRAAGLCRPQNCRIKRKSPGGCRGSLSLSCICWLL